MAHYNNCQARVLGNTRSEVKFYCGAYEIFVFDWRISEQDWENKTTTIAWKLLGKINTSYAPEGYYADFPGMGYSIKNHYSDYPEDENVSTNGGYTLGTQDNFRLTYGEDWKTILEGEHVLTGALSNQWITTTSNLVTFQPNFFDIKFWWGSGSDYQYSTLVSYRPCLPFPYLTETRTSWLDGEVISCEYYVPYVEWNTSTDYISLSVTGSQTIYAELYDGAGVGKALPTEIGFYTATFEQDETTREVLSQLFGEDKSSISVSLTIASRVSNTNFDELFNEALGNPLLDYSFSETQSSGTSIIIQLSDSPPIINVTVEDVNETAVALTGDSSKLILHVSDAKVTASVEGQKGATIQSVIIEHNDSAYETTEHTFTKVENNIFTISATDSRSQYGYLTVTPDAVPYIPTTAKIVTDSATGTGELTVKVNGLYWTGNFGTAENSLKVFYRLRKASETEFGDWVEMESLEINSEANTYEAAHRITGLDYLATYVIQAYALDAVGEYHAADATIATTPIFDWGQRDFNFNVPVTIMGSQAATKDDILPRDEQTAQLEDTKAEINQIINYLVNAFSNHDTSLTSDCTYTTPSKYEVVNSVGAVLNGNILSVIMTLGDDWQFGNYTCPFTYATVTIDSDKINWIYNVKRNIIGYEEGSYTPNSKWYIQPSTNKGFNLIMESRMPTATTTRVCFDIPVGLNYDAFVPVEEEVTE